MAPSKPSGLRLCLLAAILLLSLGQGLGDEPTYKDCRPHIDATIRDLASKALNAGEEPSDEPPSHVYGDKESSPDDSVSAVEDGSVPEPSAEVEDSKGEQLSSEDASQADEAETEKIDLFEAEILKERVLSEYETDISKIKGLSKMLRGLEKSLKGMKQEALEKYDLEQLKLIQILQEKPEKSGRVEQSEPKKRKVTKRKLKSKIPGNKIGAVQEKVELSATKNVVNRAKKDEFNRDSGSQEKDLNQKLGENQSSNSSKSKTTRKNDSKSIQSSVESKKPTERQNESKNKGVNTMKTEKQERKIPVPEGDFVKSDKVEHESPEEVEEEQEHQIELTPDDDTEPSSVDTEKDDDEEEEIEEITAFEESEEEIPTTKEETQNSNQEVPSSGLPAQKPVAPTPEFSSPPPAPTTPVYTPPAAQQSDGIINKAVYGLFGRPPKERDPKYAQPWQTHTEHLKVTPSAPVEKVVDTSSGFIGQLINKFVTTIFGKTLTERDPKYAQPWQTHAEHQIKATVKEDKPVKNVYVYSEGILHKFIVLIFGDVKGPRDPKFAEPWQTHEDQLGKFLASSEEKDKKEEKAEVVATGGILDGFIRLVFPSELGTRDPKYAKPWQTHNENIKPEVKVEPSETTKAEPLGGPIDKLVSIIFNVDKDAERDPKYAQPWQTHQEHAQKSLAPREPKIKPSGGDHGCGIVDSFITTLFGAVPSLRDEKWAEPWQTHAEHLGKPSGKAESSEKKVVITEGGLFDSIIQSIFNTPKNTARDSKWAEPWQTHDDSALIVPTSRPRPTDTPLSRPEVTKTSEPAEKGKESEKVQEKEFPAQKTEDQSFQETDDSGDGEAEETPAPPANPPPVADVPPPPQPEVKEEKEVLPTAEEDDEEPAVIIPGAPRSRDHIEAILGLDATSRDAYKKIDPIADSTLKDLKNIYASSVKPLEDTYKYQDISNRHMSDAQIFGQPLVLMLGPYSTGKSSFLNYLMGIEYTRRALRTGANPSHGVFRIIQYGSEDQELDGTSLIADWSFRSLQKFGQNFVDQLRGRALNVPLLKKVTFVEAPGILEMRRPGERQYPFNDVLQWFIDRADLVLVMFDYTKLDAGYELEAALDQLKGREAQVRILLNKADQIPPEELIKVQGSLFWNLSPLLGASAPPTVYAGSFSSRPYRTSSPAKLFQAQEEALLHDIAKAINNRVDNRVAIARRHAVRVRNHAQMVDTYLTTYFNNKGFLTSKHKLAEDIVENPHLYNIYEGMSLITNISRYDLPDPEVYRDFFRVHNLYDFPTLKATCTYLQGCPQDKIDKAISADLPELLNKYRRQLTRAGVSYPLPDPGDFGGTVHASIPMPNKY